MKKNGKEKTPNMIYCCEETDQAYLKQTNILQKNSINPPALQKRSVSTSESMRPPVMQRAEISSGGWAGLRLTGWAGGCGLVVAAVHFLLHGTVVLQLLAGVVGDFQEAAGFHHHVGLAGVRQDRVLWNHLEVLVTRGGRGQTADHSVKKFRK